MFTGIVQAVGQVTEVTDSGGDRRVAVRVGGLDIDAVELGDSIAVSGVCLTVVELRSGEFVVDVSRETLSLTTSAEWTAGSPVNLEKSLTLATPLGGHLMSGHIDGLGEVVSRVSDARSTRFEIRVPQTLSRYVARKGSIAVDGVSLTVNEVDADRFTVNAVPHTLQQTIMDGYGEGTRVNIEVDMLARYIERLAVDRE